MTYLTALCDDEAAELDKTEKLLSAYDQTHPEVDFVIERFVSVDELLYRIEDRAYEPDLIFMDIIMPGERGEQESRGIEAAKKLRTLGSRANLFFLTTSKEYALEAFDVDASQYLLKPLIQERMFDVLDRFLKSEEEKKRYLLLKLDGRLAKVPVNDILYCEAHGKVQCLHLVDGGEYLLRMTLADLYGQLSFYREFVRVGAAFVVNLEYIDSMSTQDVCLTGGGKIYLPRGAYKGLREKYFDYYCKTC